MRFFSVLSKEDLSKTMSQNDPNSSGSAVPKKSSKKVAKVSHSRQSPSGEKKGSAGSSRSRKRKALTPESPIPVIPANMPDQKQERPSIWKNFLGALGIGEASGSRASETAQTISHTPEQRQAQIFDLLKGKAVSEIMVPRIDIEAAEFGKSIHYYLKIAIQSGYSRIPVYEEDVDEIVGILHVKDLLRFSRKQNKEFNVKPLLRKPYIVPETMELTVLLKNFLKNRNHIAIAVDEYGGVSGIVTLEDILEELVGEIQDEFDQEQEWIKKLSETSYLLDGRLSMAESQNLLQTKLPEEDFDTLGGFIYHQLGRLPEKGDTTRYENLAFKVAALDGKRIKQIQVDIFPKQS